MSIKECDADYTFAEEDDIMSKNRYKGLCPCMHLHIKYHHTQHTQHHTPHPTTHKALHIHSAHIHTYVHCRTSPLSQFCMPTTSGKEIYSAQLKRLTHMHTYPITTHTLTTRHTTHAIPSSPQSLVYMHHLPQSLTSTLQRKMAATSMHQKYR